MPADPPSTLGGPGWRPRSGSHAADLVAGQHWRCCGSRSEVARLRDVMITDPALCLDQVDDPGAALMMRPISLPGIRADHEALLAAYTALGVRVHPLPSDASSSPNLLFARDLFWMTPAGAIVGRMAAEQRAGEERYAARALALGSIPIVGTIIGGGTFEGADALWLGPDHVLVGVGRRTNAAGLDQIRRLAGIQGIAVEAVPLEGPVQHLLGAVTFARSDLATVHPGSATDALLAILRAHGITPLILDLDAELTEGRGNNFVAVAPGRVLMPAGCPGIRVRLEDAGVACHEVAIPQYLNAAGGVGCLTGILRRDSGETP